MVALRGQVIGPHPVTGVNGIWFQRTADPSDTWVGMSKAELQALPTGGGSAAQRRATYIANATTALQNVLGPGYTISIDVPAGQFDVNNITTDSA